MDKLIITFPGRSASLKTRLQEWCKENGERSMNGLIRELISKHLKTYERISKRDS